MKTILRAAAVLSLAAAVASAVEKPATEGAVAGQWTMDLDAARKVAAEQKRPLLLNFTGSDWCGWCKLMDKSVFSQEAWQAYARTNLMLVWVDFPQDASLVPEKYVVRNRELSEKYGVEGYPTYILLDDDGQTRLGQLGADRDSSPARFIAQLEELAMNRRAAVEALLQKLPAATAQRYQKADKDLAQARKDLAALEADYQQRSTALEKRISTNEEELQGIRTEARLATLPKEKIDTYKSRKSRRDAVEKELQAWIATRPERNEENAAKFKTWQDELQSLDAELQALLSGK